MSLYKHHRNYSLLAPQSQTTNKIKISNRSLHKIQNIHNNSNNNNNNSNNH